MKIAVVGAGNMGGAIARGLVKAGTVRAADVTVSDISEAVLQGFSDRGCHTTHDNVDAVKGADVVFVVVKPWLVEEVVKGLRAGLDYASQIFVCIAAGITPEQLSEWLGQDADGRTIQSFLVIPNTAIDVLQSMTFITPVHADQASVDLVKGLFDTMGSSMVIEYGMMAAATAVASCGIAYAMRYILDAARGGVEMGFDPSEAVPVVCQTMIGAIGLMTREGADPEAEIVKVCTPGGLTLKGLKEMEEAGFTSAVIRGLKASVK
jgi:pyrroline-5-carboxylate reductase